MPTNDDTERESEKWSTTGSVIEWNIFNSICYIDSHWARTISNSESITSVLPAE